MSEIKNIEKELKYGVDVNILRTLLQASATFGEKKDRVLDIAEHNTSLINLSEQLKLNLSKVTEEELQILKDIGLVKPKHYRENWVEINPHRKLWMNGLSDEELKTYIRYWKKHYNKHPTEIKINDNLVLEVD